MDIEIAIRIPGGVGEGGRQKTRLLKYKKENLANEIQDRENKNATGTEEIENGEALIKQKEKVWGQIKRWD